MRTLRLVAGVSLLCGLALSSTRADAAAPWVIQGTVSKVALWDKANGGGAGKIMQITFATAGKFCSDTNTTLAEIGTTDSTTFFEDWVRLANSALLSGKQLRIQTNLVSNACRTEYLELWN